jgi:hypothetical protein
MANQKGSATRGYTQELASCKLVGANAGAESDGSEQGNIVREATKVLKHFYRQLQAIIQPFRKNGSHKHSAGPGHF